MKRRILASFGAATVALAAAAGVAVAQQDREAVRAPEGLGFSDFKGYGEWQPVSVSQPDEFLNLIAANPTMQRAYAQGLPSKGKAFPDGSMSVKYEWAPVTNPAGAAFGKVAGELRFILFMVKDSKRFPASGGWGYAKFEYDPASKTMKPTGRGTDCGHACHSLVASQDYVFTTAARR